MRSSSRDGRLATRGLTMWGRRGGKSKYPHRNIAGGSFSVWEVRAVPVLKRTAEQREPCSSLLITGDGGLRLWQAHLRM